MKFSGTSKQQIRLHTTHFKDSGQNSKNMNTLLQNQTIFSLAQHTNFVIDVFTITHDSVTIDDALFLRMHLHNPLMDGFLYTRLQPPQKRRKHIKGIVQHNSLDAELFLVGRQW